MAGKYVEQVNQNRLLNWQLPLTIATTSTLTEREKMTDYPDYQHGNLYKGLHTRYPEIWRYLNEPEVVIRMEEISPNEPAVMALNFNDEPIMARLMPEQVTGDEDRIRRMIGNQIRQIMERNGWEKTEGHPKSTKGKSPFFVKGACYRRRQS